MMQVIPVLRWWRNYAVFKIRRRYVVIKLSIYLISLCVSSFAKTIVSSLSVQL